jgi:transcriptional regulator with XRE-family HTH domain
MTIGEAVRKRILELCEQHGLSVNKLCTQSRVTQSTVNNLISGRNNSITIATLKKLCDGLGISILAFFDSPLFHDAEQELR